MNYVEVSITMLTQLLGVAANDKSLSKEDYNVIKKFIDREIRRLRGEADPK